MNLSIFVSCIRSDSGISNTANPDSKRLSHIDMWLVTVNHPFNTTHYVIDFRAQRY